MQALYKPSFGKSSLQVYEVQVYDLHFMWEKTKP
jgi:hypothetical protein